MDIKAALIDSGRRQTVPPADNRRANQRGTGTVCGDGLYSSLRENKTLCPGKIEDGRRVTEERAAGRGHVEDK